MSDIIQDIRDSVQELASKYCKECHDTCCNAAKNLISLEEHELSGIELFLENNIPLYRMNQLDESSLMNWVVYTLSSKGIIYDKEHKEIKQPALIEHFMHTFMPDREVRWLNYKLFTVYSDNYCPFFNQNNGCNVYEDSRRPNICMQYPIDDIFTTEDGNIGIVIARTCPIFTQSKVKEELKQCVSANHPGCYINI
jgi:hypothetical protein